MGAIKPKGLNRIAKLWSNKTKGLKQDSQIMGAIKPKNPGIDKFWEQ